MTNDSKAAAEPQPLQKTAHKNRLWPFGQKNKAESPPQKAGTDTQSGPKDPPVSPYPLIRVPMTFQAETQIISAGIYLLKPSPCSAAQTPQPQQPWFSLTQRNQTIFTFPVRKIQPIDTNLTAEGTPSPLSKTNPAIPEPTAVRIQLSPDQKSLSFQIRQQQETLESQAFPVAVDRRTPLNY